ncbi:MAG TPA: thioredoxin family protein [Gemmataceae bacterium]|nr:thioredoxin family protein [Gemmataceae bacterium]
MNLYEKYQQGLKYHDFLARHGTSMHQGNWQKVHEQIALTPAQKALLQSFTRSMPVLCLAGAWCGDCVNQCPIFAHFEAATPTIQMRYIDRDVHADAQAALQICGGNRVPVLVFFSEDGFEAARCGDRTISKYRAMMRDQAGPSCPTGITVGKDPLLVQVTQDWLQEFERVQWMLRLSQRLRNLHND